MLMYVLLPPLHSMRAKVAKMSKEQSKPGEGVVILANEPYHQHQQQQATAASATAAHAQPSVTVTGQFTHKEYKPGRSPAPSPIIILLIVISVINSATCSTSCLID